MNKLHIQAAIQIQKSKNEVFEAIVNPEKMSNYFISKGSARMEENKIVNWEFPEFEGSFPVRVGNIRNNEYISFYWDSEGKETLVEITLSSFKDSTVVTVTEKEKENNQAGITWLKGNTEGWANFLACLKAWIEYGIHLRKGAFDFRF